MEVVWSEEGLRNYLGILDYLLEIGLSEKFRILKINLMS